VWWLLTVEERGECWKGELEAVAILREMFFSYFGYALVSLSLKVIKKLIFIASPIVNMLRSYSMYWTLDNPTSSTTFILSSIFSIIISCNTICLLYDMSYHIHHHSLRGHSPLPRLIHHPLSLFITICP
jgi:hypothetical protein